MGLFDFMSPKANPTPVVQQNTFTPSAEQQKLLSLAMPYMNQYANQTPEVYGGQVRAGLTPLEQEAQSGYLAQVPGINNLGQQAMQSQQFMLGTDQLNPDTNPFIKGVAERGNQLVTNNLLQQIIPSIQGGETVAGGMYSGGSSRGQMAERLASNDAVRTMADATNQLYFNNYQSGINNIARAQQLNPSVMAQGLFGSDVQAAVGGQQRAEQQAGLDESFAKWNLQQQLPYLKASELLGLVSGIPGGTSTTSVTGAQPPKTSAFASGLGGALTGASVGSAFGPIGTGIGGGLGLLASLMSR